MGSSQFYCHMPPKFEKTVLIQASPATVWKALTEPEQMKLWMGEPEMNLSVHTSWQVGSPFTISGFHHARFENRGTVLQFEPHHILSYTHLSSLSRLPDVPESYTRFTFVLAPALQQTQLTLTIDNFPTETIYQHLAFYWRTTVEKIRLFAEQYTENTTT